MSGALHLVHDAELDPEEERIVMLALSRVIGEMEGWRSYTYNLCRIVAALDALDLTRDEDGQLQERTFRSGKQVMLSNDWKPEELGQLWISARRQERPLDRELIAAFVPEWLWPSIARLIAAGPEQTTKEARGIFDCWAAGLFSNGDLRPTGKRSANTIQVYIAALWVLMRRLCDMREAGHAADATYLADWARDRVPKAPMAEEFDAEESSRDRSAPPLLSVRRALKALTAEIDRKRRYAQTRPHMFGELRDRVMFVLLVIHGMRAEALWALNVEDFLPDHEFPDGSRGAALIVPRVKRERVTHTKFIPPLIAEWIKEYLDYIDAKAGEPMWRPARKGRRGERLSQQTSTDVLIRTLSPHCKRASTPRTRSATWHRALRLLSASSGSGSAPQSFYSARTGFRRAHKPSRTSSSARPFITSPTAIAT